MTETITIQVTDDIESVLLTSVGVTNIINIYKIRHDNTFDTELGYEFTMEDTSFRVKTTGYSKIVILYEKTNINSTFIWEKNRSSYGNIYSMSFFKNNIYGDKVLVFDIDNIGGNNISANISITTENEEMLIFDTIVDGEYAYSSIKKDGFIYESITISDNKTSSYGYIYKPGILNKSGNIEAIDKVVSVKNSKYSISVELFIFRSDGQEIEDSPIIRGIRLKDNG